MCVNFDNVTRSSHYNQRSEHYFCDKSSTTGIESIDSMVQIVHQVRSVGLEYNRRGLVTINVYSLCCKSYPDVKGESNYRNYYFRYLSGLSGADTGQLCLRISH